MGALDGLRKNWHWGVVLLSLVLLIGACGGSDSAESGSTAAEPTATAVSASGGPSSNPTSAPQPTATQESFSGGGGNLDLEDALDEVVELYEELLQVLAGITDEESARAAVDDVTRITSRFEGLDDRMDEFSEAEIASAAISTRFFNFGQELSEEMMRIASNPAVFILLAEAFEDLN